MSYVDPNYKSKKDFKTAVDRRNRYLTLVANRDQYTPLTVGHMTASNMLAAEFPHGAPAAHHTYNPSGMFLTPQNGSDVIEGPHYPQAHRWYASVQVEHGIVVKVTG
jgi:hypothetical protein